MIDLRDKLQSIYASEGSLDTNCCRQGGCCRVACPQLHYSEAAVIWNKILTDWDRESKKRFLMDGVRHFFSRSLIKPCPIFDGNGCRTYEDRPLNCRLYGLVPQEQYAKRVEKLMQRLQLPMDKIPLNQQCQWVKRVNGEPLTAEAIERLDAALDQIDAVLISEGKRMAEAKAKVSKGWNYRTISDWALYFVFGEDFLSIMSQRLLGMNAEDLQAMVSACDEVIEATV